MSRERRDELIALLGGMLMLGLVAAVVVPQTVLTDGGAGSTGEPSADAATADVADESTEVDPGPRPGTAADPEPAPEPTGDLFVLWARGGLSQELAAEAAALPGVAHVAFVRSGTLGLVGARDGSGAHLVHLDDGWRIPVAAVAVDPEVWAAVVGAGAAGGSGIAALRPGTVVLSRTGAELRGIGVGGTIDLDTLAGLEVVAVVPDEQARGAELLLHAEDGDLAGVRQRGSLVLRSTDDAEDGDLSAALEGLVPAGTTAQVVGGDLAGYRAPLVLTLPEVKSTFGEFRYRPRTGERGVDIDPGFVAEHIVWAEVPILGEVRCHRGIIEELRAALGEIAHGGLAGSIDPDAYAGCFNARRISTEGDALSHHAWGIAFDINVDLSLPGLGEVPPPELIEIFGRHGFRWGGDFLQPDNHHFEWVGSTATERP